jgi:hypothetical protein
VLPDAQLAHSCRVDHPDLVAPTRQQVVQIPTLPTSLVHHECPFGSRAEQLFQLLLVVDRGSLFYYLVKSSRGAQKFMPQYREVA